MDFLVFIVKGRLVRLKFLINKGVYSKNIEGGSGVIDHLWC